MSHLSTCSILPTPLPCTNTLKHLNLCSLHISQHQPSATTMKSAVFLLSISLNHAAQATTCGNYQCPQPYQTVCEGDTRGDRRCNHDATHRVCAKIGDKDTSFFKFTGQRNWCQTSGQYGGKFLQFSFFDS